MHDTIMASLPWSEFCCVGACVFAVSGFADIVVAVMTTLTFFQSRHCPGIKSALRRKSGCEIS